MAAGMEAGKAVWGQKAAGCVTAGRRKEGKGQDLLGLFGEQRRPVSGWVRATAPQAQGGAPGEARGPRHTGSPRTGTERGAAVCSLGPPCPGTAPRPRSPLSRLTEGALLYRAFPHDPRSNFELPANLPSLTGAGWPSESEKARFPETLEAHRVCSRWKRVWEACCRRRKGSRVEQSRDSGLSTQQPARACQARKGHLPPAGRVPEGRSLPAARHSSRRTPVP